MGRFESNSLAPRPSHHPPRDSRDLDGRLSGSLAAFKFAIRAQCKTIRSDSFRNDFAPRPILLFQKMRGWLRVHAIFLLVLFEPGFLRSGRIAERGLDGLAAARLIVM